MRGAIASEAGKRAGKTPAEVVELVRLVSTADSDLFSSLVAADIDGDVVIQAAAVVTGMPAAPRLLLRNPTPPADIDAVGIRDAGGVPIGSVQGRTWIAFSDPGVARAAIFSDDVVVCLAVARELRGARAWVESAHPEIGGSDTVAMPAVTPEAIERWRRQNAIAGPATELHAPRDALVSDDEDLFDRSGIVGGAKQKSGDDVVKSGNDVVKSDRRRPSALSRREAAAIDTPGADDGLLTVPGLAPTLPSSSPVMLNDESIPRSLEPEQVRLLRLAQLGRLRRFRFERVLGRGALATVYLARGIDEAERAVAVKILAPEAGNDAVAVGRFRHELRTLKALDHRRIVAPIDGDAEDDGGVFWLSCRYLDGGTLLELIDRVGPLPAAAAVPIIAAILEGLHYAHGHGVVHSDLKPSNVLLDHDGNICVADFGVARAVDGGAPTQAGARFGTAAYMSPEQAADGVIDARSDLFSTGVLLYHLVSGHNPLLRSSLPETLAAVARAEIPALPPVVRLPTAVTRLLEALLAHAVEARPPDAASALRALQPVLARMPSVDVVIKRLLADPRAFAGVGVVDFDADDSTVAESASTSDDEHSAFGAVMGMRATFEMPLSSLGPGGLAALREQSIEAATADDDHAAGGDNAADGDDAVGGHDRVEDDGTDDDSEAGGRGVAAFIGFTVAGLFGLLVLLAWWFSQQPR